MAATNRMVHVIEHDGTITTKSEGFSEDVHDDAEGYLEMIEELAGGSRTTEKRKRGYVPVGQSQHSHTHHRH